MRPDPTIPWPTTAATLTMQDTPIVVCSIRLKIHFNNWVLVISEEMWSLPILMGHPPIRSTNIALADTILHNNTEEALAQKIDTHGSKTQD